MVNLMCQPVRAEGAQAAGGCHRWACLQEASILVQSTESEIPLSNVGRYPVHQGPTWNKREEGELSLLELEGPSLPVLRLQDSWLLALSPGLNYTTSFPASAA